MPATATRPSFSLARALNRHAGPLADAQNTYKQNVVVVNTYVTGVLSSKLPTLNSYPQDWSDFATAYEAATSSALTWVNTVMARLLSVPGDVQNYNATISQLLQDAENQANTLVDQPGNGAALASLNQDLSGLSSQLALVTSFIASAISSIQTFQDQLPAMSTQLQTIVTKAIADNQADQDQINQLNASIQQLQNDISNLTAAIIALSIADAAALTIGTVTTIALWPVGAVVWFVMGPAVALATTYIALDAKQIIDDKAAIAADQKAITGLTADVAVLSVLANTYQAMVNQTTAIETALQAILTEWQTLESDVAQAVSDIQAATSDTTGANFSAVAADLSQAIVEWSAAYAQAGSLSVQLQVNNAQLELGMSSTAVQSALAGGQTTDVISYYNSLAA